MLFLYKSSSYYIYIIVSLIPNLPMFFSFAQTTYYLFMRCFDGVKNTLLVSYLNHDIRYSCSRKYNNKSQYHIYQNNNYLFSHYNKNSANSNFNIIDNHIVNHEIYSPNLHKTIYDIDRRI